MVTELESAGRCKTCPVRLHGAAVCWRDLQEKVSLLGTVGVERRFAPGETLYRQGDHAAGWWIVRGGQVLEYMVNRSGREQIVRLSLIGSVCGMTGLGPASAHWATARAGRHGADTWYVSREQGWALARSNPEVIYALLAGMTEEVRFAYHKLHGLSTLPARAGIAHILLSAAQCAPGEDAMVTLSRKEISSMAGVAVETVVRVLNDLRSQGLIRDQGQHRIVLCDSCRLYAIAEGLDEQ